MKNEFDIQNFYSNGYNKEPEFNTPLAKQLMQEINTVIDNQEDKAFPNVLMFADESALFWVTEQGEYVWMQEHKNINAFVDELHPIEERRYTDKSTEGVSLHGVYWMNNDFDSPFGYIEFEQRISQINI
jgi:hypothetical protein